MPSNAPKMKIDPFAATTGGLGFVTMKTESSFKDDDDILDVIADAKNLSRTNTITSAATPVDLGKY